MFRRLTAALAVLAVIGAAGVFAFWPGGADAGVSNDDRFDALNISIPYHVTTSNEGATVEPGESSDCGMKPSIWFRFTAQSSQRIVAQTNGSDFDTAIAVFLGDSATPIVCNDDYNMVTSQVSFMAEQGMTYYIQAGGYNGNTGSLSLRVDVDTAFASMSGTVRGQADSHPLANICVRLTDAEVDPDFGAVSRGKATTAADGTYVLDGLAAGSYHLQFEDCDNLVYGPVFYHGAITTATAQTLVLGDGVTMTGLDQNLQVGGTLSGQVTEKLTGIPLANVCIDAGVPGEPFESFASTDAQGMYTLTGLNNTYIIHYESCGTPSTHVGLFLGGVLEAADAIPKTVAAGAHVTGINMELPIGAKISGMVTNRTTGLPQSGVCVAADLMIEQVSHFIHSGTVKSDGTYVVGGLPAGGYKLYIYGCGVQMNAVWYDDKPNINSATLVNVDVGEEVTGIDFVVGPTPIQGDGDCNGKVTTADLVTGLRYVARFLGAICADLLDVNCDHASNARDMLHLLDYFAGLTFAAPTGSDCPLVGAVLPTATPVP